MKRFTLGFLAGFLLASVVMAIGGCATAATAARKTVGGMYTAVGAVSAILIACNATATAQADSGDMPGAMATFEKCGKIRDAKNGVLSAADAASKVIDAADALGSQDFVGALSPMLQAGCKLNAAVRDFDASEPVIIPCGG